MRDGKTIVIGLKNTITYHISISTYIDKYTSKEKELENGTKKYSNIKVQPNGKVVNINVHSEYHGKENYQCIVAQSYNEKLGKYSKGYRCYKFNPERTMYKSVMIKLTYNQSSSKQYTYQDLQKRAKRTIDSLYIKDGW